jgi:hypothetical protein
MNYLIQKFSKKVLNTTDSRIFHSVFSRLHSQKITTHYFCRWYQELFQIENFIQFNKPFIKFTHELKNPPQLLRDIKTPEVLIVFKFT